MRRSFREGLILNTTKCRLRPNSLLSCHFFPDLLGLVKYLSHPSAGNDCKDMGGLSDCMLGNHFIFNHPKAMIAGGAWELTTWDGAPE